MKRIALALLAVAGLGFVAGSHNPTAERCSSPGSEPPAAVNRISPAPAPVETPLVEKLLPKKPAPPKGTEHIVGDKAFFVAKGGDLYVDGTITKDGFFKYEVARNIYVPVDHGHPQYNENGHPVTLEHLISDHGHAFSSASKWTRDEIEIAHANSHYWEKSRGVTRSPNVSQKTDFRNTSACPNGGNCPNTNVSRGWFRRR